MNTTIAGGTTAWDVAQAVAAELKTQTLSPAPKLIEARFIPVFDLSVVTGLQITVVPESLAVEAISRIEDRHTLVVDLGIQKKLGPVEGEEAEVGALLMLVNQIIAFLSRRTLAGAPFARFRGFEADPLWRPDHMLENRVFTSVLRATYSVTAGTGIH